MSSLFQSSAVALFSRCLNVQTARLFYSFEYTFISYFILLSRLIDPTVLYFSSPTQFTEMQTKSQTLLNYLTIPNPEVCGRVSPKGTNSKSKSKTNEWRIPTVLGEWEDFEYDTLTAIYNGDLHRVLQKEFSLQDFTPVPIFPFCQYSDENSLESLLIKWNQSVVTEALEKSQGLLNNPAHCVFMVPRRPSTVLILCDKI